LHAAINPVETLFVVDAMQGQDAVNTAKAFKEALPLTGIVLTKPMAIRAAVQPCRCAMSRCAHQVCRYQRKTRWIWKFRRRTPRRAHSGHGGHPGLVEQVTANVDMACGPKAGRQGQERVTILT
jgi:signal recognition particle subunit SRP54